MKLDLIRFEIFLIEFFASDSPLEPSSNLVASRIVYPLRIHNKHRIGRAASGSYSHTQYYGAKTHSELGRVLSETVRCATAP
jgi:hypothetical protein